jgi:hypothetical protein
VSIAELVVVVVVEVVEFEFRFETVVVFVLTVVVFVFVAAGWQAAPVIAIERRKNAGVCLVNAEMRMSKFS